jgi:hypothetical protein
MSEESLDQPARIVAIELKPMTDEHVLEQGAAEHPGLRVELTPK